jgi:hypothetical protein
MSELVSRAGCGLDLEDLPSDDPAQAPGLVAHVRKKGDARNGIQSWARSSGSRSCLQSGRNAPVRAGSRTDVCRPADGKARAQTAWPHIVLSGDGTPISYEVHGAGEPTLVFVHGKSCDARYWRAQAPYFSRKHRVAPALS